MDEYIGAFKKYATFSGRATRREYWMFTLINLLISIGITIAVGVIMQSSDNGAVSLLSNVYGLATFLPSLALGARRLHDINRSGWWLLISLVPLVGFIVLLIFMVTDSQAGDNKYGPNPKMTQTPSAPVTA